MLIDEAVNIVKNDTDYFSGRHCGYTHLNSVHTLYPAFADGT